MNDVITPSLESRSPLEIDLVLAASGVVPHSGAPRVDCTTDRIPSECGSEIVRLLWIAGWDATARLSHERVFERAHSVCTITATAPGETHPRTIRIVANQGDPNLSLYSRI